MHPLPFLNQQSEFEQKNVSDRIPLRQCQHQMLLGVCLCCAGLNAPVKLITLDLFNKTSLMPFSTRGISDTWTIVDSVKIMWKKTFWWICWTEKNVSNGILRWRLLKGGLLSKHRKIFSTPGQNNPRWEYLWAACVEVSECLFLTTKMNIASMHYGNIFEDNSPVYKTGE